MSKGVREQSARNEVIVRLAKKGTSANDIAAQFAISPARVRAIVKRDAQLERRRVKLKKKYGGRPKIEKLPDEAPIDVLVLCEQRTVGWAARVRKLTRTSLQLRTLGDLRHTRDIELLTEPRIGVRFLAELRTFCAYRRPQKQARG